MPSFILHLIAIISGASWVAVDLPGYVGYNLEDHILAVAYSGFREDQHPDLFSVDRSPKMVLLPQDR